MENYLFYFNEGKNLYLLANQNSSRMLVKIQIKPNTTPISIQFQDLYFLNLVPCNKIHGFGIQGSKFDLITKIFQLHTPKL